LLHGLLHVQRPAPGVRGQSCPPDHRDSTGSPAVTAKRAAYYAGGGGAWVPNPPGERVVHGVTYRVVYVSCGAVRNVSSTDDEEKKRLQVQLAKAQDRIRALGVPREDVNAKPLQSVEDELAELVRQKRKTPSTS
jgi:hypothetical protein